MSTSHNPYASALDGLVLDDPVVAFFAFCREREAVRVRRDSGQSPPWSADPIFQRGRFLNVFREDDRVSKAILRFAAPLAGDSAALVRASFFARWCNRDATLDALPLALLDDPDGLQRFLLQLEDPPWCNVTAYPVQPVAWSGRTVSRFDTATRLFHEIAPELTACIVGAEGDVIRATGAVNRLLGMDNAFPIFMAVMDLAWFRPDLIDPASPVPTGIGAAPYLDRLMHFLGTADHTQTAQRVIALQPTHWPDARRALQPIDVEYLCCECRKYFSYVTGTKAFEGKNRFVPGASPAVTFDIADAPAETVQTGIHVLAGGPCSGKTTLLAALAGAGHRVVPETSRQLLDEGLAAGHSAAELRADPVAWQQRILALDYNLFEGLPTDACVFTDTSFIENLPFAARAGLTLGPNVAAWLRHRRYARVFFLAPVAHDPQDAGRVESPQLARRLGQEVRESYRRHGYDVVDVPAGTVQERLALVLARMVSVGE